MQAVTVVRGCFDGPEQKLLWSQSPASCGTPCKRLGYVPAEQSHDAGTKFAGL